MMRGRGALWALCCVALILAMAAGGCSAIRTGGFGKGRGRAGRASPRSGKPSMSKPVAAEAGRAEAAAAPSRKGPSPPDSGKAMGPVQIASKITGLAIMSGSCLLKMPQIVKILSTKSVEGLSSMAIYHELPLYSSGVIYHWLHDFPLSTYGEMLVIMLQNMIVVVLLWMYREPRIPASEIVIRTSQFILICLTQMKLPKVLQPLLVYVNIPLLITSCMPQILANSRQRHTGTLAISTCAMKAIGSAMRVFTTIAEIGADKGLLASYGLSATLNGWMVIQGYMFREETKRVLKRKPGSE